jgi:hypothetical protein
MTLPHPQADDLLAKCEAYQAGQLSLPELRAALGEAAAAAEGDLLETLIEAKDSLDSIEEGSDDERQEADPSVATAADALRNYLP